MATDDAAAPFSHGHYVLAGLRAFLAELDHPEARYRAREAAQFELIGSESEAVVVPTADPEKDNELVEAVQEAREETHAVNREYLEALEMYVFNKPEVETSLENWHDARRTVFNHGPVVLEDDDG